MAKKRPRGPEGPLFGKVTLTVGSEKFVTSAATLRSAPGSGRSTRPLPGPWALPTLQTAAAESAQTAALQPVPLQQIEARGLDG